MRRIKAVIATLLALLIILCIVLFCRSNAYDDPYIWSEGIERITKADDEAALMPAFAHDISVLSGDDTSVAEFSPEAGLLCQVGGTESIFDKNALEKLNPASTTKIMTALLAVKYGTLTDEVIVPDEAVITEEGASLAGIVPGDKLTMEQLLYGLMLPSGNDAANAIAMHMAGSLEAFADMMNEEAASIGAVDTHFVNANGLTDPDHYTSAYDLYLIINEAMKYPVFAGVAGTSDYVVNYTGADGAPVSKTWSNGNKYLSGKEATPDGVTVISGKTGTTKAAGSCLVLTSENDEGDRYVSVVLKADNRDALYDNMSKLLQKITQ